MTMGGVIRRLWRLVPPVVLAPPALVLLAGCQKADNEPGPGGVTVGEARALDRAAAMIEAQVPPEPAAAPGPVAPATGAGDRPVPQPSASAPH